MDINQLLRALGLQQAYQAYQQNIGQPFANVAGPFGRGLLGLDKPEYGQEQAYRTGQAVGNMPAVSAPVGAFKAAMQAPEAIGAVAAITPKAAKKIADALVGQQVNFPGAQGFDPRFDPRVNEQQRLQNLKTTVEQRSAIAPPTVNLAQFEGYPFITSMSDRSAAGGLLTSINDVLLKRPVNLQGGQDFMFENPGQTWASAKNAVSPIMQNAAILAEATGKNPIYIPWRMAPTGGDFATMTGESMLSFAESAFGKGQKKVLDKKIKEIVPNWPGIDATSSMEFYRQTPDSKRKQIQQMLDVEFRESGGLGRGEARLAVSDPKQLQGFDTQIMNIGRIFADQPMVQKSGHYSYPYGVPGEGIGRVAEDIGIFQLLPNVVKARGILDPRNPAATDVRALQMKPYAGIITEDVLRGLGY
jgi:hypothetical protein